MPLYLSTLRTEEKGPEVYNELTITHGKLTSRLLQ